MKKTKILVALTTVAVSAVAALGLTACKKQTDNKNAEIYAIYTEYVAYAESNGEKPLSYEEWLSTIKGEKGDKGDKGDKGEKGENGKDGEKGEKGENGKDGHTPIITIGENGNWFIDGVDTKVKAQGEQGEKGESGNDGINGSDGKNGESGKSAYEIYKEKYGYEGTEEEWLDDLVNGRLALKDKYTVTFDSDGGSEVESQEVTAGKKANEPDIPTKTGYTFGGWFVKTTEWNFLAYTVIENVTLKAKWIANEYTLKFNSDGGNEIADMTVTYDGDYTLPKLTKENYVFLGWKEGEIVYAQSGKWKKTSGATLTAEWVIAKSTITFETNGGSIVAPMTINYGEDYTLPTSTRENYALVGWFLDEKKFEGGTPLTGDITLSAKWQGVTDTFEYTEENGEITLAKFKGGVTDVIIPANINDVAVTKLADGIFRDNTEITSVTFDGSFENYDAKLFQGCTSLRSLVISGVYDKELYYLFGGSINDIPESFIEITFAKNSNYVDGTMFKNKVANHIVTYVIPDGTTKIRGFNGWRYMKAVHIPDSATSIGTSAFEGCSGLTSISIPNGVTSIGMYAFRYCSSLTSISIPNGVTRIGDSTFSGCSSLTSIFLPDSITEIWDWAFSSCKSLTSINIPQNVKYVRSEAFENCDRLVEKSKGLYYVDTWIIGVVDSSITTAVIKDTTRGIASSAGSEFYGITNVYITDLAAWCNIAGLENIMCGGWNSESKKYDSHMKIYLNNKLVTDLTIPDGVTNIASYAFYNCELTSVTIPDSVTSVGDRVFKYCNNLESITIPDHLTDIDEGAFAECNNLKKATLPVSAISCLPTNAKTTLETVVLTVGEIPSYAFAGYSALKNVEIRDKVTGIGEFAFRDCSELTNITIGNGVISIGLAAFFDCSKLDSVNIPKSIEKIEKYAFNSNLTNIYYDGDLTSWCKIEGLDGLLNNDTTPENLYINGKEITVELVLPDETTEIKSNAFFGCSKIISVTIPDSVTRIESSAFEGCSKLVYIEFKGTIEQWYAVSRSSGWNSGTGNYVVHCTNGNINK